MQLHHDRGGGQPNLQGLQLDLHVRRAASQRHDFSTLKISAFNLLFFTASFSR
jgi:hypothetical protein